MKTYLAGIAVLALLLSACGAGTEAGADVSETPTSASTAERTTNATAEPTAEPTPIPTPEPPSLTIAQSNAISSAQSYLDYSAFSRKGLIDQLVFEGYSLAQAEFGVAAVGY